MAARNRKPVEHSSVFDSHGCHDSIDIVRSIGEISAIVAVHITAEDRDIIFDIAF
jgi:hypothetical protein